MTMREFITECGARLIDPVVALDDDRVFDALRRRDDDEVIRILDEEY